MSATVFPVSASASPPRKRPFRWPQFGYSYPVVGAILAAGIGSFAWVYSILAKAMGVTEAHFRLNPAPLTDAGWVIQSHVAGAVTSFILGLVILFLPKGSKLHRKLGWTWVATMTVATIASFFIRENGQFTWIHSLTALTAVMLPMAVAAARMHYAKIHARFMAGVFLGGAFTAGLFTFLPGRLMWDVFFAANV